MIETQEFKKEVLDWAQEIGTEPKEIHVRQMKRKWASCSSRGRLSFSYDLLKEPFEVRAKAVVHELLHLKYPTHNKMFKSLLAAYLSQKGIEVENILL
jgi:hypothetical protein